MRISHDVCTRSSPEAVDSQELVFHWEGVGERHLGAVLLLEECLAPASRTGKHREGPVLAV